ncbi:hypothetical protein NQ318_002816 [Aromia moschata]|uniref:Uncharacterized protein n=1 Tax=Aromia moschata TaxID=1265417 RepID=A0AAV8XQK8_9CUCU|nr:hypothetical protein NQ318_002816 [Aromia moschata]
MISLRVTLSTQRERHMYLIKTTQEDKILRGQIKYKPEFSFQGQTAYRRRPPLFREFRLYNIHLLTRDTSSVLHSVDRVRPSEILARLRAQFVDETLSKTQVYQWQVA